jgi:hypothetical protein
MFETGSYYGAWADLKLKILLSQLLEGWDYRHEISFLAIIYLCVYSLFYDVVLGN